MIRAAGFLCLLFGIQTSSVAGWPEAFPEELIEEIQAAKKLYSGWGLERHVRRFGMIARRPDDGIWQVDWDSQTPVYETQQRFLRSEERFRRDSFLPKKDRRILAFDGHVARVRDRSYAQNGPIDRLTVAYYRQLAPVLPHSILIDQLAGPPTGWIFDDALAQRTLLSGAVSPDITVNKVDSDGHSCWKISWQATRDDEGGLISFCDIFLARDQDLMPIRQTFITPINRIVSDECYVTLEGLQKCPDQGRWLPDRVKVKRLYDSEERAVLIDFKWSDAHQDSAVFSRLETLAPALEKPVKTAVAAYQPTSLLTNGANGIPTQPIRGMSGYGRPFSVTSVGIAFLLMLLLLPLCVRTRPGIRLRTRIKQHPMLFTTLGLLSTVIVGYLATYPPGWSQYGIALMLTGTFGLVWIVATCILAGDRTISIRLALCTALCAAITFSGYSMGGKRMAVRERMIREIRDGGGQVMMGLWRLDEPGLYLPRPLDVLLGEAWTGRASKAAVAEHHFTADNVENWCLDEVRWLGIGSESPTSFKVSGHPFSKLRNKSSLWTVCVSGGSIDATAVDELKLFPSLVDLHFDCNYQPIEPNLRELDLERLQLTRPLVDDRLLQILDQLTSLESVTLIQPKFTMKTSRLERVRVKNVFVEYASLDARGLAFLGKLDTVLHFSNCKFRTNASGRIRLDQPSYVEFVECDLDDQTLRRLSGSPHLEIVMLRQTDVTLTGIENFSKSSPAVSVLLQ
ncbi:MAG: hypothetical protein AAGJ83_07575 [Planctomycetota bacterium]